MTTDSTSRQRAITGLLDTLTELIDALPLHEKIATLNRVRGALHEISPFRAEPVDCILWLPQSDVAANEWNPNSVPGVEFAALTHSMQKYGITMPIVGNRMAGRPDSDPIIRIDDGFHRHVVVRRDPVVAERVHGHMPVSLLKGDFSEADEMSATILHNQARGTHSIEREMAIVASLEQAGWSAADIGQGTVKTKEELIRIHQASGGAAKNLSGAQYGKAWDF